MTEEELKEYVIKLCKNKTPIPKPKGTISIVNVDLEKIDFNMNLEEIAEKALHSRHCLFATKNWRNMEN